MSYYSQYDQDRLLDQCLFQGMRNGTFVDIGAYDGVTLSNSRYFEEDLDWRGVCIEADPSSFAELQRNRPTATNLNVAAGPKAGIASFVQVDGYAQMLSGFADKVDSARIEREVAGHGGVKRTLTVEVKRVGDILTEHGITDVHYLSLDVEGAELDVLAGIDFAAVSIHAMTVEYSSRQARQRTLQMLDHGFVCAGRLGTDLFLVNRNGMFADRATDLHRELTRQRGPWLQRMLSRWRRAIQARGALKSAL